MNDNEGWMTVGRGRTISAVALGLVLFGALAAPWQVSAQSGDDAPPQETPAGTPPQRENPRGVPGPDVLKRRLENLRVPAKTQTGREGITATTATPTPAVTAAAASTPPPPTPAARPGTGGAPATANGDGQSFGAGGLIQTNPKSVKALPWNTKVTLGQIDDTDLEEVIKTISRVTARNFIYDKKDVRNQKVTILTPSALTVGEAYQAFQTALEAAGLTLVQVGPNLIRILPRRDAAQKPLDTEAGTSVPWNDSFVTRIIRLQNIDVGQIQGILQQLASKDGAQVQAFAPTNSLIVTDTANNIRRLAKIIEELDRSGGEENIEVIQIKHADVNDVADKISQLFGTQGGAGTPAAGGRPAAGVRRPGNIKTPAVPVPGGEGTAPGAGTSEAAPLVSKVIPDARTNQIIVVANDRAMQALADFLGKIDVFQDEGANIHVYYLENADAEELATVLSNLAQGQAGGGQQGGGRGGRFNPQNPQPGGLPQQGGQPGAGQGGNAGGAVAVLEGDVKITSDKATNALVITASKSDYAAISSVIKKLDIRRQQVYVEAVIMELSVTRARELGLSFGGGFDAGDGAIGYGGLNAGNALFLDPARLATGFALGLIGAGGVDVTLADGSTLTIPPFGVALNALQTDSDVNVLSRPTILAKENEEAEIVVGTQIAIPGNVVPSAGGIPIVGSPTREDVGITLKVTPKINESDLVSMAISQEVKSAFPQQIIGTQRLVDLAKRSAKTNVVVKNGQTIVIGGLLSDEENRTEQKIPLLGDIPFLGWLFRNQTKRTTKTNLLIFLTPTIVNDEVDMQNIYQRRIREREEFLKLYGNRIRRKEAKRRLTLFESYYGSKEDSEKAEKKRAKERANEKPFEPVKPVEGAPGGTMTAPAERSTIGGDPPPADPAATDTDDTPAAGESPPVDTTSTPTPAPAEAAPTATPEPNP